jgi:phage terminase large subunit-like protein
MKKAVRGRSATPTKRKRARPAEAPAETEKPEGLLFRYRPYPKQRRFHDVGGAHAPGPDCPPGCDGRSHRERMLMGANQSGKTWCGAAEAALHLTGLYPPEWTGRRFGHPTRGWIGCDTFPNVRDGAQRLLVGEPKLESAWGTGLLPRETIVDTARAGGVPDLLDHVLVRHVSGGISSAAFKSYDQGRRRWQGETLDWVWFDEEPPQDIYTEGLTRTNATNGVVWLTFTPLEGMSRVVHAFIEDVGGLR